MTGRIPSQLRPKEERICPCGNRFITSHFRKKFCKRRCRNDFNVNSPDWNTVQRNYKYKINYGISVEDYNKLFNEQNGCCAICKKHQSEFKTRLHVDHCHKTKIIRGLLCHNCNLAIGRLYDDPKIIASALEYVKSLDE